MPGSLTQTSLLAPVFGADEGSPGERVLRLAAAVLSRNRTRCRARIQSCVASSGTDHELVIRVRAHHWESFAHCLRVGAACLDAARDRHATVEEREALGRAGLLHGVGKVGIETAILTKPSFLSLPERERIRDRARIGFEALGALDHEPTRLAVLAHHRFGSDPYPGELENEASCRLDLTFSETDRHFAREMAQVVAVADVLDALSRHRAYKAPLDSEELSLTLQREYRGDAQYVDLLLRSR